MCMMIVHKYRILQFSMDSTAYNRKQYLLISIYYMVSHYVRNNNKLKYSWSYNIIIKHFMQFRRFKMRILRNPL